MRFLTIFERATKVHLGKDVGMLMDQLCNRNGWENTLITNNAIDETPDISNTTVKSVNGKKFKRIDVSICKYILFNAKKYDYLTLFHLRIYNLVYGLIFLCINPNSKVYIKADRGNKDLEVDGVFDSKGALKNIEKILLSIIKRKVFISYESRTATELAKFELGNNYNVSTVNNGHDIEENKVVNTYDKEKLIISVGRIGAEEKNHKLIVTTLLSLLEDNNENLLDYKVVFVGPVEPEFKEHLNNLGLSNQFFNSNIVFTGNIDNKKELYDIYSKAKYFLLSSLREGSPLVVPEAMRFGCIFVTTPVSTVEEVLDEIGFISNGFTPEEYKIALSNALSLNDKAFQTLSNKSIVKAKGLSWEKISEKLAKQYV